MRRFFSILIIVFLFIGCASKNVVLPESLDKVYIQNATEFAKAQFECCMTQKYVPITNDIAIPSLVRFWNEEETRIVCQEINQKYGDLVELKIAQTLYLNESYIYRFKAKYSKLKEYSEIRVSTNLKHKFNSYFFKEVWLDKYTKFKPRT